MAGSVQVRNVNGVSVVVGLTTAAGTTVDVFSDSDLSTPVSLPATITDDTTFYVAGTGGYLLSVTAGGTEIAGPVELFLDNAGPVAFAVDSNMSNSDVDRLVANAGGGGGSEHSPIVSHFPFAFDSAGISTGGFEVYTPTVGDILLDAWIEIDTAWDGTTPLIDVGNLNGGHMTGLWNNANGAIDATAADTEAVGCGVLGNQFNSTPTGAVALTALNSFGDGGQQYFRTSAPSKFIQADPLKIWVTQNGHANGSDPGSSQGAAVLYLVTVTPA